MVFTNIGLRKSETSKSKINNPDLTYKVLELFKKGFSLIKIETELKGSEYKIRNSTASTIYKQQYQKQLFYLIYFQINPPLLSRSALQTLLMQVFETPVSLNASATEPYSSIFIPSKEN